jgi:hypothetical protein
MTIPTCEQCGARLARPYGPTIEMEPLRPKRSSTDAWQKALGWASGAMSRGSIG